MVVVASVMKFPRINEVLVASVLYYETMERIKDANVQSELRADVVDHLRRTTLLQAIELGGKLARVPVRRPLPGWVRLAIYVLLALLSVPEFIGVLRSRL